MPACRRAGQAPATTDVSWLQPIPDALLLGTDPAAEVEVLQSVRLALVAALQHLPARQRAVLILREVLRWRAAEVATLLDTTSVAVDSALQRARAQLASVAPDEDAMSEPSDPGVRDLLDRYVKAFETADIPALTRLLTEDATFEMPPYATWFAGRETVSGFLATRLVVPGAIRMVPTVANGQPAFGTYVREDGRFHAHAVQVLTATPAGVSRIVQFIRPSLFERFGLTASMPDRGP